MKFLKYAWIFLILISIGLNSCSSSHVTSNNSIQKRKYNKGWFFKKGGSTSSVKENPVNDSAPESAQVQSSENKRRHVSDGTKTEDGPKTEIFNEVLDVPVFEEVRQSVRDAAGIQNQSNSDPEQNLLEKRAYQNDEKEDPNEPVTQEENSKKSLAGILIVLGMIALVIVGIAVYSNEYVIVLLVPLLILLLLILLIMVIVQHARKKRLNPVEKETESVQSKPKNHKKTFLIVLLSTVLSFLIGVVLSLVIESSIVAIFMLLTLIGILTMIGLGIAALIRRSKEKKATPVTGE